MVDGMVIFFSTGRRHLIRRPRQQKTESTSGIVETFSLKQLTGEVDGRSILFMEP